MLIDTFRCGLLRIFSESDCDVCYRGLCNHPIVRPSSVFFNYVLKEEAEKKEAASLEGTFSTSSISKSRVARSIQARSHTFVEIDHEIISMVMLNQSRMAVVSYKRKYVHKVLVPAKRD